ncbi:MAG TPA: HAD hydrolase-like protein [Rhizobiaceae bacterium]|nr:HAD hydrolase-like protein [Rhizobiaceae bacterium]
MPAKPDRPAVLFDLDGTLTNPFLGISRSIQYALQTLGYPVPEAESLRAYIGPPLQVTFPKLLASDDAALSAECLRLYRARYADVGKFENELIPGIVEAVASLADAGYFLAVATSKLETYSREIVEHFGLAPFFDEIYGSQLDGSRADKGELIAHIVKTERLDPAKSVMIGDRLHDVVGAQKNGMKAIGVLWGFGDRTELENAGAAAIAERPDALAGLVAGILTASAVN